MGLSDGLDGKFVRPLRVASVRSETGVVRVK